MKCARRLSSGADNVVPALNETEVAKLYTEDARADLGSEAQKMKIRQRNKWFGVPVHSPRF